MLIFLNHKIKKELIINIYMLIKSVIKACGRRLIIVILHVMKKNKSGINYL
jgi:hypothetical protein